MIDLTQSATASPRLHEVPRDPGREWVKDSAVAIDAPPDNDLDPAPDARWPFDAPRTGLCGAVCPRVLRLADGSYRMYYTQILPRPGFPDGANDYENSTTRILSAISRDGLAWTPEPGVRLAPEAAGPGILRAVSSDVVPTADGRLRMYYECCPGAHAVPNAIGSAVSDDGLAWTPEPGKRLSSTSSNFASPRILHLDDGRVRLFCLERGRGIISAISSDGGFTFTREEGVRIASDTADDALVAFASEIVHLPSGEYVMYHAGYSASNRAQILRATSEDAFHWKKEPGAVIAPGPRGWDAVKSSEMCVYPLPGAARERPAFRMLYEACDGSAVNARGVWRIAAASSAE